ncbi:hypothetical protein FA95DRAFT_1493046, partial [Auriscalpium vulgare]
MLRVADKHNASFAALRLSRALCRQLPAWYRIGEASRRATSQTSCLRDSHRARSSADLLRISHRLTNLVSGRSHFPRRTCACNACVADRLLGCQNPHKCALAADAHLRRAAPKFNPLGHSPSDGLSLTHRRRGRNTLARASRQNVVFDPSVACKSSLAECFRIF